MLYSGSCHCGAIRIGFETGEALAPRACQCSFCRKHGARTVSDAAGAATLSLRGEPLLYRFATRGADYVLCATCGAYAAAMTGHAAERRATLNLNLFDDPHPGIEAAPVSYEQEGAGERAARRAAMWTPLRLVAGGG